MAAPAFPGWLSRQSGPAGPAGCAAGAGRQPSADLFVCLAALYQAALGCAAAGGGQFPVLHGQLRHRDGQGHDSQHPADRCPRKLGLVQHQAAGRGVDHRHTASHLAVENPAQTRQQRLAQYAAHRLAAAGRHRPDSRIAGRFVPRSGPRGAQQSLAALHDQPDQPRALGRIRGAGPHTQQAQALCQHHGWRSSGCQLCRSPETAAAGTGGWRDGTLKELQPQRL
ncbi:hypothetical protein SDC9_139853 [bioreactor metagenome]|uniref:Uncharacterized protein n=1 Tax=bioreactor metagenome TaxID=1076179 RepID=A0A645DTN9_9ZZZZ